MDIFELLSRPHDMNPGSAAPYLEGFGAQMAADGYLSSAIHFGGWVAANGLEFADINEKTIRAFGVHRCRCPGHRTQKHVSQKYVARVQRFAEYLRQQGAIRAVASSPMETLSPL